MSPCDSAWPELPEEIKAGILEMVKATSTTQQVQEEARSALNRWPREGREPEKIRCMVGLIESSVYDEAGVDF